MHGMSHPHDLSYVLKTDDDEQYFVGLVEQIPAIIVEGNSSDEVDANIREATEQYIKSLTRLEHDELLKIKKSVLTDTSAGRTVATRQFRVYC